jgi:hypothetical protein
MAETMTLELEVVGPHRGKTFKFRDYQFVQGRITISGPIAHVLGDAKYLGLTQQAYPVGSTELREAIRRIHGELQVQPAVVADKTESVLGGREEISERPAEGEAAGREQPSGSEAGQKRVLPGRDGLRRPKAPADQKNEPVNPEPFM